MLENFNKVIATKAETGQTETEVASVIHLTATGMRANLKDVFMAYKRKTFPKMSDIVSFDADIGGLTIDVLLVASDEPNHIFDVTSVTTTIDNLPLQNIEGIDHSHALYTMFKPVLQFRARRKLSNAISQAITNQLMELDCLLGGFKDRIAFAT